jgi:short-subunit dehydrogenase
METNVFGVLRTVYATLDDLRRTRGCLAIVGSVNSYIPLPRVSAYCMSKFAVRALAGSLRHELASSGVGVVFVAPGYVDSEIRKVDNDGVFDASRPEPTPRWLRMPADLAARKIARAIQRRKPEYVFTAHGKVFVWLERHTPWLLHGLIGRFAAGARPRS